MAEFPTRAWAWGPPKAPKELRGLICITSGLEGATPCFPPTPEGADLAQRTLLSTLAIGRTVNGSLTEVEVLLGAEVVPNARWIEDGRIVGYRFIPECVQRDLSDWALAEMAQRVAPDVLEVIHTLSSDATLEGALVFLERLRHLRGVGSPLSRGEFAAANAYVPAYICRRAGNLRRALAYSQSGLRCWPDLFAVISARFEEALPSFPVESA